MTKNYFVNSNNIIEEKNTPIYITNTPDDDVIIQNSITGFNEESDGFKVGLDGNSNGIISHRENKDIILSTNNTEKLRLSSSLVKTNGPHQVDGNLEVNGNLKLHSDINMENSADFKVKTNNLERLTIANSGLVKTNGPHQVDGNLEVNGNLKLHSDINMENSADFKIKTNNTERLVIKNDGKVGIGTATPTELLDVDGNIKSNELNVNNSIIKLNNNLGSAGQVMKVNNGANALEWGSAGSSVFTTSGNDIYYNSGNVGIGTTAPKSALQITGDRTNSGSDLTTGLHFGGNGSSGNRDFAIELVSDTGKACYLDFGEPTIDQRSRIINFNSTDHFSINSSYKMTINPGGNGLGIATDNPSQKLHVIGNILASGSITANSDMRIKKNIIDEDLNSIYENFKLLKLKNYSYDEDYCKATDKDEDEYVTGLLAQEVAEIYPDVVEKSPQTFNHTKIEQDEDTVKDNIYEYNKTYEDFHIIKNNKLMMKMIGVLSVAQNKIDELEEENISLEGEIEDMIDKNNMIQRVLDNLINKLEEQNII